MADTEHATSTSAMSKDQPDITVYWLNKSRSQRILFLLEEIGLQYKVQVFHRDAHFRAPPELKIIHPLGKSPIVRITDPKTGQTDVLVESGNIVQQLVERYAPHLALPHDHEANQKYRHILHFTEGTMMPPMLMALVFNTIEQKTPFFLKPIIGQVVKNVRSAFIYPELTSVLSYLNNQIKGNDWIAGKEFSAADCLLTYPLETIEGRAVDWAKYEGLHAYMKRIQERPAYKRAEKRKQDEEEAAVKGGLVNKL